VHASDDLAVVFLIDASDSVDAEKARQAENYVRAAIKEMKLDDQAAIVVFGANALVDRPMSSLAELAPIASVPQSLQTDVAEAIRLGLALFPSSSTRRLVLISDGVATVGNSIQAAELAVASGVEIDILPLSRKPGEDEVLLTGVDAPAMVGEGEIFNIEVSAESSSNIEAVLRVLTTRQVVYEDTVILRPGTNNFSLQLQAMEAEFARYLVQLTPTRDTFYQNNQLAAFTNIVGPPKVLLVSEKAMIDDQGEVIPDESSQLRMALQATGLVVVPITPAELPVNLEELAGFASLVLVNVNAKNLSPRKMDAIQRYVRELGGGLVAVGGPESYGMGGYFRTPLEDILPVEMQIKDQERFPSVSIALVIDRSGSMAADEGGLAKIQLAAEGAARVVDLLNDFDEITIIPVDTQPDQLIGPAPATERSSIIAQIRQIGAGGGGIFVRTGLEVAADALAQSPNQVKHIILLADGADSEEKEGVPELIEGLTAEGITVSTVAIGSGPDVSWLQQMAQIGGGRFHFTDRAANLPQIFTQETTAIQRSYLIEERFFPTLGSTPFAQSHAIFRAMDLDGITRVPPLFGYVGTSPKATGQVILASHLGDPLLTAWEYGLGRAVAWTSDATGRWGADWVSWAGYPAFWSTVVRWSIQQDRDNILETELTLSEGEAMLTVDARDEAGNYLNSLTLETSIIAPNGEVEHIALQQVAPGRYEAAYGPTDEGAYLFHVTGTAGDRDLVTSQTTGWILGYSPEYGQLGANPRLLNHLAEMTGGRTLSLGAPNEDASTVFDHNFRGSKTRQPIWPWLLGLAIFLLPIDIAVRRLAISRQEIERASQAVIGRRFSRAIPPQDRSVSVARLFDAKRRASTPLADKTTSIEPVPIQNSRNLSGGTGDDKQNGDPETASPENNRTTPNEGEGSLASQLLAKRRQRQANGDDEDE